MHINCKPFLHHHPNKDKKSIKTRRKLAGWDTGYLADLLVNPDSVPWLRTIWLPIYGVVAILLLRDPSRARRVVVGAALSSILVAWAFASASWSIDSDVTVRRAVAFLFTTLFGLYLAAAYDWRKLIDSIPTDSVRDLRDRALIATLTYSFARITAARLANLVTGAA